MNCNVLRVSLAVLLRKSLPCLLSYVVVGLSLSLMTSAIVRAQSRWVPSGPDGGDARAFATDPHDHNHVFLGTTTGTIYDTHDGGQKWTRLARIGDRDDLVIDNIVVNPVTPDHILVGAWGLGYAGGGFFASDDGGRTWTSNPGMDGHSVLALTMAPSDPKVLVIGALDGVFRSVDGGGSWSLISPEKSKELHEVESIAIDPKDPQTIFAGTWHLPWKTTDGGQHWTNMKEGIIDDSDVFSIIVDSSNSQNIFLSACSGIYRSPDSGGTFAKVQGIPATARRTRVLMQDSTQPSVVFAGTTEGLWRSSDSGHTFQRYGDPSWIINDVSIDKDDSKRVLLATDRIGILLSTDGGLTFVSSNLGFSSRKVSAVLQEKEGLRLHIGVINDKSAGGVFTSVDGGLTWAQNSTGLGGADVLSLGKTSKGTLLAGTRHGLYRLESGTWQISGLTLPLVPEPTADVALKAASGPSRSGRVQGKPAATKRPLVSRTSKRSGSKKQPGLAVSPVPQQITTAINAIASDDGTVFAATEEGLLTSLDDGHTWNRVPNVNGTAWRQLAVHGSIVVVADLKSVSISVDKGVSFHPVSAPAELTAITAILIDGSGTLWIGGREGVYLSDDGASSWHPQKGLFVPDVSGLYFDQDGSRVLVTSNQRGSLTFGVHVPDMTVTHWESGWDLREVRPVGDHLMGVTRYDGVVLQPLTPQISLK